MIRAISLTAIGAAAFVTVYWATTPNRPEAGATATITAVAPAPAASNPPALTRDVAALTADATAAPSTESREIRNVTPTNMTAAPPMQSPPERVAAPAKTEAARPAHMERLFNPLVVSAGAIEAKNRTIRLAGIAETDPEALCGEGAKAWPCGRLARAALRSFIRGRAIDCEVPAAADAIPDPARCVVGGDDIAEWLVAQGWAKASGDDYSDATKTARDTKLGLYSDARPDAQPDEIAARR